MKKICVIGSINMDVVIRLEHVPAEGENVYCESVGHFCGGKGENQAIALSRQGIDTVYFGCVGKDAFGSTLLENLDKIGVDASHVLRRDLQTGVAYILLEKNGNNRIIVAPGANEAITAVDIRTAAAPLIEGADLVLIQLEIALEAISEITALCQKYGKRLVVDAGPIRGCKMERLQGAFCVSPNETELSALIGEKVETQAEIVRGAEKLLTLGARHVVVKLGSKGSLYVTEGYTQRFDAYPVKAVDTTGAGDSFMAGFCAALCEESGAGESERESVIRAIGYATKCGAVAVTRLGAVDSMPSRADIERFDAERAGR